MAKIKTPARKPDPKSEDENTEGQEGQEGEDGDDKDDSQDENQRINAIVTSRVKREMKAVNQQLQAVMQKLETMSPKKEDADEDDDTDVEGQDKKEVKPDLKTQRQLTKLQKELQEERDARKKAELAQKEEKDKSARQEMVSQFDAALTEHGVTDPILRKSALRHLEAEGYMVRDEDSGKIKFKGQDKYGLETMFDPKAGVKQWVLTEGKSFIPAVEAGGSGTGAARQGVGNSNLTKGEFSKMTPQQKASIELERASAGLPPLE